jgi:hypothetical protein
MIGAKWLSMKKYLRRDVVYMSLVAISIIERKFDVKRDQNKFFEILTINEKGLWELWA